MWGNRGFLRIKALIGIQPIGPMTTSASIFCNPLARRITKQRVLYADILVEAHLSPESVKEQRWTMGRSSGIAALTRLKDSALFT